MKYRAQETHENTWMHTKHANVHEACAVSSKHE